MKSFQHTSYPITEKLIGLHEKGYVLDFNHLTKTKIRCIQNNCSFFLTQVAVSYIDQYFYPLTKTEFHVFTVENCVGEKGILCVPLAM